MNIKKILIFTGIAVLAAIAVYFGFIKQLLISEVAAPTDNLETFSNSYVTGYEGDFINVTYKFKYPKDKFALTSKVTNPSLVSVKEISTGLISTVKFFYNGAAGFPSAKELWENRYKSQCLDCVQSKNDFNYSSNNIATFSNSMDEWIIFSQIPGYIVTDLKKPFDSTKKILESLSITEAKAQMPEFSTIKAYFANDKINPIGNDCKNLSPSERQIIKTTKVATAALELLLDGPTQQEKDGGYVSAIPSGSELNSISIGNGTAYADFNQTTESGGGSCSMAMRVAQINQTLLQFPTINNIVLSIDGRREPIFQP